MSTINTNGIDSNYPTPGQNNSSQGFRDNFTSIKNNINTAGTEITELQQQVVVKSGLQNIAIDNNMANTLISNAAIRTFRNTTYNLGNNVSGTVVVNTTLGDVQYATITGNTTFNFSGWAPTNTKHTITLDLTIANTEAYINFPAEVTDSGDILENNSVNGVGSLAIATAPYGVDNLTYDLSTIDCGNSILISPVNRGYQSSQIELRPAITPTGYQGDRNGDIAVTTTIAPISITSTTVTTDVLATANTVGMYVNMPIEFTGRNGNVVFGGVTAGTDYFVTSITANTNFSVSLTESGANVALSTATSTMQASPIEYTYQCVGTYDSVATVTNIESSSAADDKITFTATVADIASYGLNQPVVFAGPNVTNAGLLPATTYYVKSTDAGGAGGHTRIQVSRTRANGVAGAVSTLLTSSSFSSTTGTVYNQGHDIWKRVKLDSF